MIGQIIRLRNGRHYFESGNGWSEFKHPDRNKVLVAVVIGIEDKKCPDPSDERYIKMLESLGYSRKKKTA